MKYTTFFCLIFSILITIECQNFNKIKKYVTSDNVNKLTQLIDQGINANMVGPTCKKSLLAWSIIKNAANTFSVLLDKGANPNIVDHGNGMTPLMYAVENNREDMVRKLIQMNAEKNIQDSHGRTAMDIAKTRNLPNIIDLLR